VQEEKDRNTSIGTPVTPSKGRGLLISAYVGKEPVQWFTSHQAARIPQPTRSHPPRGKNAGNVTKVASTFV
jgi:hypothetical protein